MNQKIITLVIVAFLLLVTTLQSAWGAPVEDAHGITFGDSQSQPAASVGCMAINITKDNLKIVNVTVYSGVTATLMNIYGDGTPTTGSIKATSAISSEIGTFDYAVQKDKKYWICVNHTAAWTEKYTTTLWDAYPHAGTNINWVGVWSLATEYTVTNPNFGWDIKSVTLDTITSPITYLSITAQNNITKLGIDVFNATINGTQYTTTNGTINTPINTTSYSLYTIVTTATGYNTITYTNYNASNVLKTNLTPSPPVMPIPYVISSTVNTTRLQINYSAATSPSSTNISSYNISLLNSDLSFNRTINTSNGNLGYLYDLAFYNVTPNTYYIKVEAKDLNNLTSYNISSSFTTSYNARINISAVSTLSGDALSGLSITLTDTLTDTVTNFSNPGSYVEAHVNRGHTYNTFIDVANYQTKNATINAILYHTNYQFSIYTTNSINLTFKDEKTNNIIVNGTPVWIELISSIFSENYTTTNGTFYVDLLSPATYTLRYGSTGYDTRLYYLTLINRTYNDITLYLSNSTTTTDVTATVYDELGNLVEGAVIKVLKYDLATNTYVLREMQTTNFEGVTTLNLVLNSEFYQFIIEYPSGTTLLTTDITYVYSNAITFQITINTIKGDTFFNAFAVDYSLLYDNNTNKFTYTFNDAAGLTSLGCMRIYTYGTSVLLINSSCVSAAAGTITLYIDPVNGTTYIAKAYVTQSGQEQLLGTITYGVPKRYQGIGNKGVYVAMILTLIMFFVVDGIALTPIAVTIPWVLLSIIGLLPFPLYYVVPLTAFGLIIGFITSRR